MKRKICVVTGSRAEFGLLESTLKGLQEAQNVELQLIVAAMHLAPEFGFTYKEIEKAGYKISKRVEMLLSANTPSAVSKSVGIGVIEFTSALTDLAPDLVVILGDRFEILAAAQAAMFLNIPLAHIHGGETTQGAIDESIRHCLTKMSHLHFTSNENHRKRVIQLGEDPTRVYCVGAPGLDGVNELAQMSKKELEADLQMTLGDLLFVVTYHPVTLAQQGPQKAMEDLFKALDHWPQASIVFTLPNADACGKEIAVLIHEYVQKRGATAQAFASLGRRRYLSLVKQASVVIGNSSSGIIEAPFLGRPTVNIGPRQKGRLAGPSVLHCGEESKEIIACISRALEPSWQKQAAASSSVYGNGNSGAQIVEVLTTVDLTGLLLKKFHDVEFKF